MCDQIFQGAEHLHPLLKSVGAVDANTIENQGPAFAPIEVKGRILISLMVQDQTLILVS